MREAQQMADLGLDEQDTITREDAVAAFAAAGDVRSAAMAVNAQTLTELADADVEAIRLRIACDQAAVRLDEANAARARADRELREAREDIARVRARREECKRVISERDIELRDAKENLERLEVLGREAVEENAAAQQGLREVQDEAVRSGQASRDAAGMLDERRRALSESVSAVELARNELAQSKVYEQECAERVEATAATSQAATQALADAHRFIEEAEKRIEQQREAMHDVELHVEELTQAYRRADEAFSVAQREYDVAAADLTDAEVSVIMAEIDSHSN